MGFKSSQCKLFKGLILILEPSVISPSYLILWNKQFSAMSHLLSYSPYRLNYPQILKICSVMFKYYVSITSLWCYILLIYVEHFCDFFLNEYNQYAKYYVLNRCQYVILCLSIFWWYRASILNENLIQWFHFLENISFRHSYSSCIVLNMMSHAFLFPAITKYPKVWFKLKCSSMEYTEYLTCEG